ncbi:MAG: hypothetical protein Q8L27_02395 [archaeon]|nr:hypothetical protein [archaeon]
MTKKYYKKQDNAEIRHPNSLKILINQIGLSSIMLMKYKRLSKYKKQLLEQYYSALQEEAKRVSDVELTQFIQEAERKIPYLKTIRRTGRGSESPLVGISFHEQIVLSKISNMKEIYARFEKNYEQFLKVAPRKARQGSRSNVAFELAAKAYAGLREIEEGSYREPLMIQAMMDLRENYPVVMNYINREKGKK